MHQAWIGFFAVGVLCAIVATFDYRDRKRTTSVVFGCGLLAIVFFVAAIITATT